MYTCRCGIFAIEYVELFTTMEVTFSQDYYTIALSTGAPRSSEKMLLEGSRNRYGGTIPNGPRSVLYSWMVFIKLCLNCVLSSVVGMWKWRKLVRQGYY